MNGIDVSRWQDKINWKKVKDSGIDFAFIKASQGGSISATKISPFTDSYFKSNIVEATKAGISCGVYHYLTGTTHEDVIAEAEYMVSILEPFKNLIVFPVALDFEDSRYTTYQKTYNSILVRLFTDIVKAAGYTPMLYASRSFLKTYIDMSSLTDLDIWYARYYNPRSNANIPNDFSKMTVWQWSDSGLVEGISGCVDLNICSVDYTSLKKPSLATKSEDNIVENTIYFAVNDIVEIKKSAITYYEDGATIPAWVKNDYDHIITKDTFYKKKVIKGGSQCVLLGKKINRKTGKTVVGINTWVAVENIVKCKT
ncbi:MAG: hypothetical protein A2Y15_03455 [Clostridiales bacterium GWF2_36_10]|nr:MAG: hypothetical protein A2Y15_03455 [Clostridiales bacterium GWF2_36_10]HAN20791.1 hypothetical protein [Clostridiales bacterium]